MALDLGELYINIGAKTDRLTKAEMEVSRFSNKVRGQFKRVTNSVFSLQTAMKTAVASGVVLMFKRSLEAADAIGKVADKIGITTRELQEYRFAASQTGVQQRTLDMALQRFSRRLGEAAQGEGELKKALEKYNIAVRDAEGRTRSMSDVLNDLADTIQGAESEQEKLRISVRGFDSEGAAVVNMLKNGSEGLKQFRAEANALGIVIEDAMIRNAEMANDQLDKLGQVIRSELTQAVVMLAPHITEIVGDMTDWIRANRDFLDIKIADTFHDAAAGVSAIRDAIDMLPGGVLKYGLAGFLLARGNITAGAGAFGAFSGYEYGQYLSDILSGTDVDLADIKEIEASNRRQQKLLRERTREKREAEAAIRQIERETLREQQKVMVERHRMLREWEAVQKNSGLISTADQLAALQKQYDDYAKVVDDKIALETWFQSEKARIEMEAADVSIALYRELFETTGWDSYADKAIAAYQSVLDTQERQWAQILDNEDEAHMIRIAREERFVDAVYESMMEVVDIDADAAEDRIAIAERVADARVAIERDSAEQIRMQSSANVGAYTGMGVGNVQVFHVGGQNYTNYEDARKAQEALDSIQAATNLVASNTRQLVSYSADAAIREAERDYQSLYGQYTGLLQSRERRDWGAPQWMDEFNRLATTFDQASEWDEQIDIMGEMLGVLTHLDMIEQQALAQTAQVAQSLAGQGDTIDDWLSSLQVSEAAPVQSLEDWWKRYEDLLSNVNLTEGTGLMEFLGFAQEFMGFGAGYFPDEALGPPKPTAGTGPIIIGYDYSTMPPKPIYDPKGVPGEVGPKPGDPVSPDLIRDYESFFDRIVSDIEKLGDINTLLELSLDMGLVPEQLQELEGYLNSLGAAALAAAGEQGVGGLNTSLIGTSGLEGAAGDAAGEAAGLSMSIFNTEGQFAWIAQAVGDMTTDLKGALEIVAQNFATLGIQLAQGDYSAFTPGGTGPAPTPSWQDWFSPSSGVYGSSWTYKGNDKIYTTIAGHGVPPVFYDGSWYVAHHMVSDNVAFWNNISAGTSGNAMIDSTSFTFAGGGLATGLGIVGEKGSEWVLPTYEPERSSFLASTGIADEIKEAISSQPIIVNAQIVMDGREFGRAMVLAKRTNRDVIRAYG